MVRLTDAIPLADLGETLAIHLGPLAPDGGELEQILSAHPDALVVVALDPSGVLGAGFGFADHEPMTVTEPPDLALAARLSGVASAAARKRWPGEGT